MTRFNQPHSETGWDGQEAIVDVHLFPSFDLRVGVYSWDMGISSCVMSEGGFHYEKYLWRKSGLSVIRGMLRPGDMKGISSVTCQRGGDDAVLKCQLADLDGLNSAGV